MVAQFSSTLKKVCLTQRKLSLNLILDEEGITLFAFHGKINEDLNGREGGTFSRDITKAKNGRWTFKDPYTKLKKGDIIYYWTYVDYFDGERKLGYTKDDQQFVVEDLIDESRPAIDVRHPAIDVRIKPTISCESANTEPNCQEKLVFSEDFSTVLQDEKWTLEQRYADSPLDPHCVIEDMKRDLFCPPVISSQISTKNKFSFKYGKVEIRAKLPKGDWIYPELLLNSLNEEYGPNYESGQIRIAFTAGNSEMNKILKGGIILGSQNVARNYGLKNIERHRTWCDDFHKFVINWKPGEFALVQTYDNILLTDGVYK
ncbi:hypothetical protein NQ314_016571 [Rhamnusium bicolor]|uniref:Uncharacterized protein n=1 Tax=Rhamnusium bicolor TaxID=1586634 RepID=A0AAV8WVV9_9CUCU|nr:hypothetical protein NQ314_016571 [Rhamnusium bicolor]